MTRATPITACLLQKIGAEEAPAIEQRLRSTIAAEAEASGVLGVSVVQADRSDDRYLRSIRFESKARLDHWAESEAVRVAFAAGAVHLIEAATGELAKGRIVWLEMPDPRSPVVPPKWKMAIVSWLAIFPTLTAFLMMTSPYTGSLHLVGRIFVNTVMIAPCMTWVIMPAMMRLFRKWLFTHQGF